MLTPKTFDKVLGLYCSLEKVRISPKKKRRISATLIVEIGDSIDIKYIKGENREDLVKEAKRILEEITPEGQSSKAALWRNGKIIANIKFSCGVKK